MRTKYRQPKHDWAFIVRVLIVFYAMLTCLPGAFGQQPSEAGLDDPVLIETDSSVKSDHGFSSTQDLMDHLREANRAYLNDEFDRAVEGYRKVLRGGIKHPDLYFSLANAYYLFGQKGLAVLFYEKTLNIQPDYDKAASNLTIVQKELIDRVEMPDGSLAEDSRWERFLRNISINRLSWMFFSFYIAWFSILIIKRLRLNESARSILFWINVPVFCLTLIFGALLANRIYIQESTRYAVVINTVTSLREGPERFAKEKMEIHEGLKVQLLKHTGEYTRIQLANGVEGFIKTDHLGKI